MASEDKHGSKLEPEEEGDGRDTKKSNAPPPDQWPKPEHVKNWKPDEFLETLEEDQDDRRNSNR